MAAVTAVATGTLIAAGVAAAAGITTSSIAAVNAKKAQGKHADEAGRLQGQLDKLEEGRPAFNNPYAKLTNQFENMSNPYANMTVATEAAQIQAEEADIALANSLDIMMETGMGAGGATSLAQAALQSKRGIAASIQAQESGNKKLEADGAASVAKQKAQGAAALDKMKAEGDVMEQEDAINWHESQMDRVAGLVDNERQNEMDAKAAKNAAIAGIGDSIVGAAGIAAGGMSVKGKKP